MRNPFTIASIAFVLAVSCQLAVAAQPAGTPVSGEKLVRDSVTALSKLQSYELDVISKQAVDDGHYVTTSLTYLNTSFDQSGGRMRIRMESRRPEESMMIVSDGNGYWFYNEGNRRYKHETGKLPEKVLRSPTPGFSGSLSAENLPQSMQSAKVVRQETLTVGDRQELCDVVDVHLKPGVAPPGYQIKNDELTIWLSHEYHVPMKLSGTFLHNTPDGKSQAMDMTILVQKFAPNPKLPASTWDFVPPPDSHPEQDTAAPEKK